MLKGNFDPCYIQGYTAALQDVLKIIDSIQTDLKTHKRKQNYKTYKALFSTLLNNRVILRECPDAFIRCNDSVETGFEIYIENEGVYQPERED